MSSTVTPPDPGQDIRPVRRALISVYDKTGLEELVRGLHEQGVALVSTGGSAAFIAALDIPVTEVADLTGFPECLEGRVKTLHPTVHAGILADTRKPDHLEQLADLGIKPFELVVVNLYPFVATVASGATPDECVEQIDIGGPSMVRAAAKNHPSVAIVTDPAAYAAVLEAVRSGGFTLEQRKLLAARAFTHTADYDTAVASWLGSAYADTSDGSGFPAWAGASWTKANVLRYGENPHQRAAIYRHGRPGLASAEQLHGKEMSYNNYVDADAAVRAAHDHGDQPTVAIIKHANPCGIGVGPTVDQAYAAAHACDPVSAYGGVVATNVAVNRAMALALNDTFSEVVVAPGFDGDALDLLREKKNRRLIQLPEGMAIARDRVEFRPISGGLLMQTVDRLDAVVEDESGAISGGDAATTWRLVAGAAADEATLANLQFAWRAVRAVKSNAILLARDGASVGIGMGQVNRVDSCRLAVARAGEARARGAVAASDAFFPFADGLQVLLDAGVRAVVAPGGSVRDEEVIAAATAAGVTMYFTGTRHFAH
ncbi:MAG TPA: bifunctional phosphoribosylaminoimidazolecarboxamide formyltransferase/IMP cyclohydrolase [Tetrasphaera sp.]|uniref:bifunctional phosphoribosylaminoimidazolecarboxamide formyltransferase/IMP cyclohydrolase n=1 Tax=Nostocoides sp. TaxID=1917966 RepID=UPI002C2C1B42|nr:bifunctional phosphoribosylaminoimidazolecarboxamide formyltransferase/IMP cyclohydrolase [Tetrasphaera sp.]HNQ08666.1 bifunctional phosphoribosylaminoimidazolecarboxamide formyltransferase/IMP cyclohydrolase [Tetrasphaera sp.]